MSDVSIEGASPTGSSRTERLALGGLALAMAASATTMLVLSSGFTFFNDELGWLTFGSNFSPETIFHPHNGHLIAVERLLYETLPRIFGPEYLPFRIAAVLGILSCAGFFFILVRRRVGGLPALAPTAILLFYGSAWNVVLAPIGLPFLLATAGGLAALAAAERDDHRGDLLALAALLFATAAHTFGVIFAIGVAIYLLLEPQRRRRIWVAVVPIALYAAWWVWALKFDQGITELGNVVGAPIFIVKIMAAAATAALGLNFWPGDSPSATVPVVMHWQLAPLVGSAVLLALALRLRRGGLGPWFIAYAVMLLAFWFGVALSEGPGRQPTTERYLFFGAAVLFLLLAEASRGVKLSRRGAMVVVAVTAVALTGNIFHLRDAREFYLAYAESAKAQLAMVELAGSYAQPRFNPGDVGPRGNRFIGGTAFAYNAFVSQVGSFTYSPEQLETLDEDDRADADLVLARAMGLGVQRNPEGFVFGACRLRDGAGTSVTVELAPGRNVLGAGGADPAPVLLKRLADEATVGVGEIPARGLVSLELPQGEAGIGWSATLVGPVFVC